MAPDAILPNVPDSERAVLGGLILTPELISDVVEQLEPADFYSPTNRRVFSAMRNLFAAGRSIDPIGIREEMRKDCAIDSIGVAAITNLSFGLPFFTNLDGYIRSLREASKRREVIRLCSEINEAAQDPSTEVDVLIDALQSKAFSFAGMGNAAGPVPLGAIVNDCVSFVERLHRGELASAGVPTGFAELDRILGGLKRGDLIVTAARPSMGKSALAGQIARHVSKGGGVAVFFSAEMSRQSVANRLIASEAEISLQRFSEGRALSVERDKLPAATRSLSNARCFVDDSARLTPAKILSRSRGIKAECKALDLIVVDYMQLLEPSGPTNRRADGRRHEVEQISRDLKAIARELDVPLMALSQLSRAPEARNPPKPILADLRETGAIEQDADVVLLLYRESYYRETDSNAGIAEVRVAKHRNGRTGDIKLSWRGEIASFRNLAPKDVD